MIWTALSSAEGWLAQNLIFTALPLLPLIAITLLFLIRTANGATSTLKISFAFFAVAVAGPLYTVLILVLERGQLANIGSFLIGLNLLSFLFLAIHLHIHRGLAAQFAVQEE
ncbi:hypothetical protein [Shimia sp. SK013]|uniref:hypothetical protein n=1 Tax=Shimia sp. SK013 TaxID=1389006 RepID=UPI00128F8A53|nr:hypothetical protein [Shimia sp. SK013]